MKYTVAFGASLAALAALAPMQASAQDAPAKDASATSADQGSGLREIVVTAEKRTSTAQTTPIALSVYDGQLIKDNNVTNVAQLGSMSPSISIGQNAGASIVAIRGVSSRDVSEIGDPAVAVSIDGLYLQRPTGMNAAFFDIARIEVLRGPQGTLYGRNATGGAINIITQAPGHKNEGYVSLTGGNYRTINAEGAINTILTDDLDMRVAAASNYNEGYRETYGGNRGDDNVNQSGRIQFKYHPGTRLKLTLGATYTHLGGAGAVFYTAPTVTVNGVDQTRPPSTAYGATHFANNTPGRLNVKDVQLHGQADYDLGVATVAYIAGYHQQKYYSFWDNDGRANLGYTYERNETAKDFSQELRLASNNKSGFKWQIGGYYFHESLPLHNYFSEYNAANTLVNLREYNYSVQTSSLAAFGQASYDITDKLKITGGVRYSHDDKSRTGYSYVGSLTQDISSGTAARTYAVANSSIATSKVTWHAGLDFQATPRNLLYAKADTGYKAGGFNNYGLGNYNPETITAYEVGSKNRFFGNKLQANLSAFYYNYDNQQVSQFSTALQTSVIVNAGKSRMYGGELELNAKLSPDDQIDASVAYLNAKYQQLAVANGTTNQVLNGNSVIQSPKWTLGAGYQHTFHLSGGGTIVPRAQTQYRSDYYLTIYNNSNDRQQAFTRTDLTLTYKPANTRLSVQAYVRNLENSVVISYAAANPTFGGVMYQFDAPRTYGAKVQFDW